MIIEDWGDFICIAGLSFMLIVIGVWALPQLPEKAHLIFSLSILLGAIYFVRQEVDFLFLKFKNKKNER